MQSTADKQFPEERRPPTVETVEMVIVRHVVGAGMTSDPIREVASYYLNDQHVFTVDPCASLETQGYAIG